MYFVPFLHFCCMFAPLDYAEKNGLIPTLWHCELSEGRQGDEGVGH